MAAPALADAPGEVGEPEEPAEPPRTVVVLLFDGLAGTMVDASPTPSLDLMAGSGVHTHELVPAFPTNSLINGVTISTGCWPEHHGIVANLFTDPERGRYDHSRDADWLTGCEHLHQAAERQGVPSAALGWYGSHSEERGALATVVAEAPDETQPPDAERAEQVLAQLRRPPGERPRLILAYFQGPDHSAHFAGQDAPETRRAVVESDAIVGRVLAAIGLLPDGADVTLVVTTDHGMLPVTHIVNVRRILLRHGIGARAVSDGSTSFLYFDDPAGIEPALEKLSHYEEFDVFPKTDPPAWSHLGAGPRVGDVILSAHVPYFTANVDLWPLGLRWLSRAGPDFIWARLRVKESHGYPPHTPGVAGVLYAWGSGVALGRELPSFDVVDLHPTVAHLLGIAPGEPVDGRVAQELLAGAR